MADEISREAESFSVRRYDDGDGMRGRAAEFDDHWSGRKLELHTLADAVTTGGPAMRGGLQCGSVLNDVDPRAFPTT